MPSLVDRNGLKRRLKKASQTYADAISDWVRLTDERDAAERMIEKTVAEIEQIKAAIKEQELAS